MHDGTPAHGDAFLQGLVTRVRGSSWWTPASRIIITWDEGEQSDQVLTLVVGSAHGTAANGGNEYGTLRGLEEAYGVGLLGHSADANVGDIRPLLVGGTPPPASPSPSPIPASPSAQPPSPSPSSANSPSPSPSPSPLPSPSPSPLRSPLPQGRLLLHRSRPACSRVRLLRQRSGGPAERQRSSSLRWLPCSRAGAGDDVGQVWFVRVSETAPSTAMSRSRFNGLGIATTHQPTRPTARRRF
jgi:hypothetical protein